MNNIMDVFSRLDRELWIVTAQAGERRGGLVATFVNQASIVPELPRMAVGLAKQHHTWELIEASRFFVLHVIRKEQLDWVWRFGIESGRGKDKLHGLRVRQGSTGAPILTDAAGWLECRVESSLDTGDRTLYLAEVVAGQMAAPSDTLEPFLTTQRMLAQAPAERLQGLKQGMAHDIGIDAAAIQAWRKARAQS